MNHDTFPNPWEDRAGREALPAGQAHGTPELDKSRLYKLKIELLRKLRSAPSHRRQDIVERLNETESRIKELSA